MTDPQLAVVGEALIDLGPDGVERPGGSPLNVAVGLARLGQPTAFVARFGSDATAEVLRPHAAASGVDLRWAVDADAPSTVARVHLDGRGGAHYEFAVDGTADFGWTDRELIIPVAARVVHFGSLASWLPPGDAVIDRAVATARTAGTLISYDPNVRPLLQPDRGRARALVERGVRHAHLVKASTDDLAYLYPETEPSEVARGWLATGGPSLVVITHGAAGVTATTPGTQLDRPAPAVRVVDTVGAGDAFTAGLLDALRRRGSASPDQLATLPPPELTTVLDEATLVAAVTCTRVGADPPTRAELRAAATG